MIISQINFMLPTQAANAIVLDGTLLIVAGLLITAYYMYKNRSQLLDTSLLPEIEVTTTQNMDEDYERESIKEHVENAVSSYKESSTQKIQNNDFRKVEEDEEELVKNQEKEVLYNYK